MGFYGIDNPNPTTPQFAFPRRGGAKLSGTCIIHTAEMYGALNTAAFCMRRSDYGCYHTVVDSNTIIEIYPYEYETWQDSETNNWAVGLSCASKAADWNTMDPAVREGYYRNLAWAAADFVTYMATKGITVPLRHISGQEARDRVPGFTGHGESGIARTDPGKDFDWDKFFRYTKEYLDGGTIRYEEDEMKPEQLQELKVFLQTVINQRAGDIIAEVRVHTAHNASKVLDALKEIDAVPNELIDTFKVELEKVSKEGVDSIVSKFKDIEITLGVKPE